MSMIVDGGGEYVTPEVDEQSTLIEQILALIGVQQTGVYNENK